MIDEAEIQDMPDILRMGNAFCDALREDSTDESIEATAKELIMGEQGVILLNEERTAMAGALVFPHFFDFHRLIATELFWWVDEEARGNGAGAELLTALELWARQMGAERLSMMSMASLGPGVDKLYERKGYRQFETTWLKDL